jgi:asparagine synthase (glutamine-hydrolysing)
MLDHRVVEWAAMLPRQAKLRWLKGKRIVRQTFGHLLPKAIWTRPKMGFGVPLDHWLRGELRPLLQEVLLGCDGSVGTLFRRDTVEQLIGDHLERRFDHAYRLWALLVFELWRRHWQPEL